MFTSRLECSLVNCFSITSDKISDTLKSDTILSFFSDSLLECCNTLDSFSAVPPIPSSAVSVAELS